MSRGKGATKAGERGRGARPAAVPPESSRSTSRAAFHGPALAVLAAAVMAVTAEALAAGRVFGSDLHLTFLGNRAYGFEQLRQGRVPLWNPFQLCGYPFVGSLQSAIFYPGNAPFLVLAPERAFLVSAVLHLLLAGVVMYAFIARESGSRIGALFAALAVAINPAILSRLYAGHVTILCGYPWLVLTILAFHRAAGRGSRRAAVLAGIGLALQILAGHPALPTCTLVGMAAIAAAGLVSQPSRWRRLLADGVIVGAVGAGLAAVQLVPSFLLGIESGRVEGVDFEFATSESMPPEGLVTLLTPFVFGDMEGTDYWGRWHLWEYLPYAGAPTLLLLIAAAASRDAAILPLVAAAGTALAVAPGRYASYYPVLFHLFPPLHVFRGPGRASLLFVVGAAAASGLVVGRLAAGGGRQAPTLQRGGVVPRRVALAGLGIAWLLGLLAVAFALEPRQGRSPAWVTLVALERSLPDHDGRLPSGKAAGAFYDATFAGARRSLAWGALLFGATGVTLLVAGRAPAALVAILLVDLFVAGRRYVRAGPPYEATFPAALAELLRQPGPLPPRVASASSTEDVARAAPSSVAHVGGYDPALPRRYREYVNALLGAPIDAPLVVAEPSRPSPLLRLMGVGYVLATPDKQPYPGSRRVYAALDRVVDELDDSLPRAFLVHRARVVAGAEERLALLKDEAFDPRSEVVLETGATSAVELSADEVPPAARAATPGAAGDVRVVRYEAHEVAIEVDAPRAGWLVLTDAYSSEWRATVDGAPADVLPANHLFRAVAVPAGRHDVVFRYRAWPVQAGGGVSLASVAFVLLLIRRRR